MRIWKSIIPFSMQFTFFPFSPLLFLVLLEDIITNTWNGSESEMTENWLVITITVPGTKGHARN